MRLLEPLVPDPRAPLARANPVVKLGAAFVLMAVLLVSLDAVTAAIILSGVLLAVPISGVAAGPLLRRTWPILAAAVSVGILNTIFAGEQAGTLIVAIGPLEVRDETARNGLGLALRLVAIASSGVLATVTTQPTELADALVQQARVSPRFAVGALAATRFLPLLARDWQTIGLARRARGVEAGRSPLARARLFASQLLGLLVGAIRRGSRMALAMEARGFGAATCRTLARPQRLRGVDAVLLVAAVALAAAALLISLALGTWRFLLG